MATASVWPSRRTWKRIRYYGLIYLALGAFTVLFLLPVVWLLLTSIRPPIEIITPQFHPLPQHPTLDNFVQVFDRYNLGLYLKNSLIVAIGTVITNLLIGPPAAYALARYRFIGQAPLLVMIISFRMVPLFAVLVPIFLLFSRIGLLDTYTGLIIAQTAFKLPFTIWLLRGFFLGIPKELEDSARIDGSSTLGAFFRIALPLVRPGLAAAAVFAFLQTWNDLAVTLVLSTTTKTATLPLGLSQFVQEFGVAWGPMSAAGVLMLIPVVVFVAGSERFLVQGLAAGSLKE